MNTTTLTQQQVDSLFVFCEKHHVHHYDIQVELVDHMANAIEEKMTTDPDLSFDAALTKVHADFGVKGFAGMVAAKRDAMERYCEKQRFALYKTYFTWPKIAMILCVLAAFAVIKDYLPFNKRMLFLTITSYALLLFETAIIVWAIYIHTNQRKKLLIIDSSRAAGFIFTFCVINFLCAGPHDNSALSYYGFALMSTLFLFWVLAYRDFTIKLNRWVRKEYPQVFESA